VSAIRAFPDCQLRCSIIQIVQAPHQFATCDVGCGIAPLAALPYGSNVALMPLQVHMVSSCTDEVMLHFREDVNRLLAIINSDTDLDATQRNELLNQAERLGERFLKIERCEISHRSLC